MLSTRLNALQVTSQLLRRSGKVSSTCTFSTLANHEQDPEDPEVYMEREAKFGAHNYAPVPVVLAKGKGALVWDVQGNAKVFSSLTLRCCFFLRFVSSTT
jgi:hypothetical protein